ncbi:hypothetical protein [Empedobacter sp. UBA5987]|uniref:hypothetical protein n=1 Tax=Empedobacter sp. UBA5987 TaxID=1946444 RepID=UPI0025C70384|nr:hypothetical protein [Empedobacter sp. UBA5987]
MKILISMGQVWTRIARFIDYQFDKVILISQSYHLKRALFLGKVFGLDCIGYNADSGPYKTEGKQSFREILANIKALLDIGNERAPEVIIAPKK